MSDAPHPLGSTRKRVEEVYEESRRKRHASDRERDRYRRAERDRYEPPGGHAGGWERRDRGDRYSGRAYNEDRYKPRDYERSQDRYERDWERRRERDRDDGRGRRGRGASHYRDERAPSVSPVAAGTPPPGTTPIFVHPRPASLWDRPAPGWERISAMAAKASGQFGQAGQPVWHISTAPPPGLEALDDTAELRNGRFRSVVPGLPLGSAIAAAAIQGDAAADAGEVQENGLTPQQNRQSRRLYVGGITNDADEASLMQVFCDRLTELELLAPPDPANPNFSQSEGLYVDSQTPTLEAQLFPDKGYAFVEFRSPEETTSALAFNGIVYQDQPLKLRRPKDYVGPTPNAPKTIHVPGMVSSTVPDGPNKLYIGGLPSELSEEVVMDLLQSLGELRAFHLVRELGNGQSKGFAFAEYVDPANTQTAVDSLNDFPLGDRKLVVQLASAGAMPRSLALPPGPLLPPSVPSFVGAGSADAGEPTTCLQMLNMVTPEELRDDEEYADIVEDVRDECAKYGSVQDVRIPRPAQESRGWAAHGHLAGTAEREGVGRVYVKFSTTSECATALKAIAGRQFEGRVVIAAFLAESEWPNTEDGGETAEDTSKMASGLRTDGPMPSVTASGQAPAPTHAPPPSEEPPPPVDEPPPPPPPDEAPPVPDEAPPPPPPDDDAPPPPPGPF